MSHDKTKKAYWENEIDALAESFVKDAYDDLERPFATGEVTLDEMNTWFRRGVEQVLVTVGDRRRRERE